MESSGRFMTFALKLLSQDIITSCVCVSLNNSLKLQHGRSSPCGPAVSIKFLDNKASFFWEGGGKQLITCPLLPSSLHTPPSSAGAASSSR